VNCKDAVIEKLRKFRQEDVIISDHAEESALWRGLQKDEIRENIINPARLEYAIPQEAEKADEEKYECFFSYGEMLCHRYIIAISHKCVVCTVIAINRRWRPIAEKHAQAQV